MILRDRYLTVSDVAKTFGIGVWTLRRLEQNRRIPPARRDPFSGYRVYDEIAVERIKEAIAQMEADAEAAISA